MTFAPERLLLAVELELVPDVTVGAVLPVLPLKLTASDRPGVAAIPIWEVLELPGSPVDDRALAGRLVMLEVVGDNPVLLPAVDADGGCVEPPWIMRFPSTKGVKEVVP
jgi:hypothetical protein